MSYHTQYNSQTRSIGLFFVFAFHVLLILAFANGFAQKIIKEIAQPITVIPIEKKVTPTPVDTPNTVEIRTTTFIQQTDLPLVTFTDDINPSVEPKQSDGIGSAGGIASTLTKPKLLKATKPIYPSAAERLGEEGATGLSLFIGSDGRVAEVKLTSSSGSDRLDEAAIKHAKRNWVFSPCTQSGTAVSCWYQTKLVWRLEEARR